ncbi:protein OBERON 2-like isoform X2 [Impatiens glandulifera]|uniref:protein OBERON 2-like isoform X2 n=1 Tax=Impatiens glandulifera TaxID=253017 RepID=UPI001FB11C68|nr:protein OBERON 2-like isoform X2 [Impatiens glandulifera]
MHLQSLDVLTAITSLPISSSENKELFTDLEHFKEDSKFGMEIDNPNHIDENMVKNELNLYPVSANNSGQGLPYAPVDWPESGDVWAWKVGKRISGSGYFLDRYLYIPKRLKSSSSKKRSFASKLSVKEFIMERFPDANVDTFFSSFSWKIPSHNWSATKDEEEISFVSISSDEMPEQSDPDSQSVILRCKAGNKMCISLVEKTSPSAEVMICHLCCSEPSFCTDCCCILCSRTIKTINGDLSYIRCEAAASENYICGHIAHVNCALQSFMAGTVGGIIGLDAEYYCRRCDARTDLVPHVRKLIKACQSNSSKDDVERSLNMCTGILRGSKRTEAKKLLSSVEVVTRKLKNGAQLEEVWKVEDTATSVAGDISDNGRDTMDIANIEEMEDFSTDVDDKFVSGEIEHHIDSGKLEEEIDQVLQELRKSQENEYRIAEERLHAQKSYLLYLNEQLSLEKSRLPTCTLSTERVSLLEAVKSRIDQIRWQTMKLKNMQGVSKGFGRVSNDVLNGYFGFETDK